MELRIKLGALDVGTITTYRDGRNTFEFLHTYITANPRHVLGQYFEDHLGNVHRSRTKLPPFFSNLLPEGGLREIIAKKAGVHPDREFQLLAYLGDDLPGNVYAVPLQDPTDFESAVEQEPIPAQESLRFSLAGAQLKFSVLYRKAGRGPTVPIDGKGGNWIAKLPSETYANVPENEFEMIRWAKESGIVVPETKLVEAGSIEGLPVKVDGTKKVFLSRRFDRPPTGDRIHQEDFAQIRNVRVSERYKTLSYNSIARITRALAGDAAYYEVVRRLAFNLIIGNGDAHLKNWSVQYPDGMHATLSPAYDLVSTLLYLPQDNLALKISRENDFAKIGLEHFARLAETAEADVEKTLDIVHDTYSLALRYWRSESKTILRNKDQRAVMNDHLARLLLS